MQTPLILIPKKSKFLFLLLLVEHAGAMGCIYSVQISFGLKPMLLTILLIHFIVILYRHFKDHRWQIKKIVYHQQHWNLFLADNRRLGVRLLHQSWFNRFMIVLVFKYKEKEKYSMILFPDSESKEKLQKLCFTLATYVG